MGIYSQEDLYGLWLNFREQSNEVQIMMDFALCERAEAENLINEFETRREVETLDIAHRGKADRGAVQYCVAPRKQGRPPKAQNIRSRFPEIAALVDNPPPMTGGTPKTQLMDKGTASRINEECREAAEIK